MPELRQLRAFVAVAEELNFTHAAERLHLGQQAVSKSVAQLERELGVALLERTTREVRLTRAGSALLERGRAALVATDAAFERAREVGHGDAGRVRVGVSPAVEAGLRGQIVELLREDAPELSVSVHEIRPGDVAAVLNRREVELVIARTAPDAPGVDSAALRPSPAKLCVPEGHRLAGMRSVALAELDGERLLTWSPPGTPYNDTLVARLAAAGAQVEPVESRITGSPYLAELARLNAIALVPQSEHPGDGAVEVALEDEVSLPLLVLWPVGGAAAAVERVRRGFSSG